MKVRGHAEALSLVAASVGLRDEYLAMVDESEAAGEGYPYNNIELARADFAAFVRELEEEAAGIGLPPGIAPQQTYLLVRDDTRVLGEIHFRPTLEQPFEEQNGHIGYNIRPSERGKGYATAMLGLVLGEARRLGLSGVLLTIEGENPASVRVIEQCGGVLTRVIDAPASGGTSVGAVRCFWIALSPLGTTVGDS